MLSAAGLLTDTLIDYKGEYVLAPSPSWYSTQMLFGYWKSKPGNAVRICSLPVDDYTLGLCAAHRTELRNA